MAKLLKRAALCLFLAVCVWCGAVLADRDILNESIIRLHVVANSDSEQDQQIKLQVRDAVLAGLERDLESIADVDAARAYLQENLPNIEQIANEALLSVGFTGGATVSLCKETFDTRNYDTFSLPAGVYEALRILIGEGQGRNWWCVVFPALCVPATSEGFSDVAAGSGFSDELNQTLAGNGGYELRFYCLDALGKLENILFAG